MIELFGKYQDLMLFTDGDNAVVVDHSMNMVNETGKLSSLSSVYPWNSEDSSYDKSHLELANGALSDLKVHTITASGRLYTIPKAAQEEAKRGLEWRKEHKRGGTPVGVNSARILANGGQIGLKKVRHIAKYFPRHEVDKKGKGYKPGEDGFPSAGRIAWALWGGDAAWRWARQIVERENAKALKAGGDYDYQDDYDQLTDASYSLSPFKEALELGEDGPQFVARLRLDGSGFDRLYTIDQAGTARVWDDGEWDDLGHVYSDIATYDRSLDEETDDVEKAHMFVDADTAIMLSAFMQERPFAPVTLQDLDPEEATLHEETLSHVDWEFIDSTLVAAAEGTVNPEDGVYTPKERSANARKQVRDATGKFSTMGSRVAVGKDVNKQGNIVGINPDKGTVNVKFDDGSVSEVAANQTQNPASIKPGDEGDQLGGVNADNLGLYGPLDTSGILGQPRAPISSPNAKIPGTLPALSRDQLHSVLYNYPAWVKSQRDAFKSQKQPTGPEARSDADEIKSDYIAQRGKETGVNLWEGDYREHPMFADLFKKNPTYNLYYNPLYAAGEPQSSLVEDDKPKTVKELIESAPGGTGEQLTPDTSDVQPMYLAIVSPDDPSAVFDLISIVPAGTNSTTPTIFKRVDKKWQKDDKILSDLMSATPPPVVPLHGSAYEDVLEQIDQSSISASGYDEFAQGGLDKNRGKAEKLRRYWVYGRGAAKIRWGMPGDWSRCVRHLAKYMGPRAKGYCNLRHKDALRIYPATHAKILRGGKNNSTAEFVLAEPVYEIFGRSSGKPKTVITAKDLQTSLFDINRMSDEMFDAEWEPEEEIIIILGDPEVYKLELEPLTAAFEGGADRNRGQAEKLRRYWLYGRGALKIRWNTPGDWTRCYRQLAKYMGVRAKGYCSLRHKEATGVWPGSKFNVGKRNIRGSAFEGYVVIDEDDLFEKMFLKATIDKARERVIMAGGSLEEQGSKFFMPLVIPEDIESGDGRKFDKGSIEYRELPLPLLWQIKTADGHNGSVVVGRIDHMERTDDGIGNAYGVFDSGPYGREAERMVREGFIRGVSADLDQFEASEDEDEGEGEDKELESKSKKKKIGGNKIGITHARVMAVTMVPKPAFQECKIYLEESMDEGAQQEEDMNKVPDGIYVDDEISRDDAFAIVACGAIAGSIPTVPPATWFTNPGLDKPTPLTVDDHGRVFGHIAAWHVNHIGMTAGTRAPRSKSKYAYFHTGVVRADDGNDYPVGQLTLAGGHASLEASAVDAARHYDDTGSAIADVHAGEDAHGIWVAGALRPSATPEQIRALRASAPSGDWRPINGTLELVAVCQVNVPGFPIARARVASGQVYALVAAGAAALAKLRVDPITELADRVAVLENKEKAELTAQIEELRARVASVRGETNSELATEAEELSNSIRDRIAVAEAKMAAVAVTASTPADEEVDLRARVASAQAMLEFADFSEEARQRLAKEGKALPNGSYPIRNESDLKNAIQAYGRSKPSERAKVRRHIMKRARALDKSDLVPEKWKSASTMADEDAALLRARIASVSSGIVAAGEEGDKTNPKAFSGGRQKYVSGVNQPRDAKGKFRQVLARLKQDLGVSGLQNVVEKVEEVENLDNAGNYEQAAASSQALIKLIDRLDSGALNATSLENIRNSTRLLGQIMANLPLPFGESAQKVRFSDLPPVLKNLIDDMIDRVEEKIGKEEADTATEKLRKYKGGGDMFSQGEVASEMNVLLRLLT